MASMHNIGSGATVGREPIGVPIARIELDNGIKFVIQKSNLPLTIGRAADCDISIPSSLVSRHHCDLYLANGVLCLKDTSFNGTCIDMRTVKRESVSIEHEALIKFPGDISIRILPLGETKRKSQTSERRGAERRQGDRRQNVTVVKFERRVTGVDRRLTERRA